MARRRKGRSVNGVVLLNKPLGISSNDALQKVKGIYFAAKAGHTGALDPLATGMLPICLGEATKFSQFLLDADKTYEVTAKLGIRTTTSDADGEVVETKTVTSTEQQIRETCLSFLGTTKQVPSMFSALKHQGKPLYFYARQGIEVHREARDITLYSIDVIRIENDEVDMQVHCSKGTYIRSLVDDIGQLLGCGAYVSRLHRSRVSDYPVDQVFTIEELQAMRDKLHQDESESAPVDLMVDGLFDELDALLLPMDTAVKTLNQVELDSVSTQFFRNGNPVHCTSSTNLESGLQVRVYTKDENIFLGVGFIDGEAKVAPKRTVVYANTAC